MRTNFVQTCKTSANRINLNRITMRVALIGLFISLGIGNAWASTTYYSKVTTSQTPTGKGTVYVKAGSSFSDTKTSDTQDVEDNKTHTYSLKATPTAAGYYFKNWTSTGTATLSFNNANSAATTCSISNCSDNSSSRTTGNAQANWAEITINNGTASPATIDAKDNSATATTNTCTVTYSTKGDNTNDFKAPTVGSATGHGTFTAALGGVTSAGAATVNVTFVGDGTYGGDVVVGSRSRTSTAVVTLTSVLGNNKGTCTVTASFPNIAIGDGSFDHMTTINTVPKSATATFPVQWADDAEDFSASFGSETGGGVWTVDDVTYTATDARSGTISVAYTFNPNGAVGDHSAVLTLAANDNAGGASKTLTLTAEAEALAAYDASIGDTKYTTLAEAITAANGMSTNPTVKILRNVEGLTSTLEIKKPMTIDLNSFTVSGTLTSSVNKLFYLNTATAVLTINDSRNGGKISATGDNNAILYTVLVDKGSLVLTKGDIEMNNTSTGGTAKANAVRIKAGARFAMAGGNLTATTAGSYAYGLFVTTNPSETNMIAVSGGTITATAAQTLGIGVYCQSSSATPAADPNNANVILDGVTVNASTTGTTDAYAVQTDAGVILGINSGTYNATAATTTARALLTSGYTAVVNGTFNAVSGASNANAIRVEAGIAAVRNGAFFATAQTLGANASVVASGAKLLTYGGTFHGKLENIAKDKNASGVYVNGTLEAQGGTFIGEAANSGLAAAQASVAVGVLANTGSNVTLANATLRGLTDNTYVNGAYALYSKTTNPVNLTNCTLEATSTYQYGYGIYNIGSSLTANNCEITVNTTYAYNYGVYNNSATANTEMVHSTITCTSGTTYAYGANVLNGTLTATDCTFSAETKRTGATSAGNCQLFGINVASGKTATLTGCTINTTGSGTYSNNGYGIYVDGSVDVRDCEVTVSNINSGAYAICNTANTTAINVHSGKFKATATSTGIETNATAAAAKQQLYGGFYVHNTNLAKYLPEGYMIETLTAGTEFNAGYKYHVRPETVVNDPVCKIGSIGYATLEEALEFVNKNSGIEYTIYMVKNYTLPAGDYTLPANATLLVPMSGQTTSIGTSLARVTSAVTRSCNVQLTFATGVNLSAFGTIETGSRQCAGSGATGYQTGSYGRIHMNEGSRIDMESGSKIYCWGYITGKGVVNAKDGSIINEQFELGDFKGGGVASKMLNNSYKVFIISHYFYQSIEADVIYRPGSQALGYATAAVSSAAQNANSVKIVGETGSGSLFLMDAKDMREDTWLKKEYDPATERAVWTLNSGATLGSLSINISGANMQSANYILPISSQMDLKLNYGDMTLNQSTYFMPGSSFEIGREATLKIPSGIELYFIDQENWVKGYSVTQYICTPNFSPTRSGNGPRHAMKSDNSTIPDADFFIHGTVEVTGSFFTSGTGANLHSTNADAGKVVFKSAAAANKSFYQCNSNCGKEGLFSYYWNRQEHACTSAKLKNGDGTYVATAGNAAGTKYIYKDDQWVKIVTDGCLEVQTVSGIDHKYAYTTSFIEVAENTSDNAYHDAAHTEGASGCKYYVYTEKSVSSEGCVWWEVTKEDAGLYKAVLPDHNGKINYYTYDADKGYWVAKTVTITWNINGSTTNYTIGYGTKPQYLNEAPSKASTTTDYYTWLGWTKGSENGEFFAKDAELPVATENNTTYYAYFKADKFTFRATFNNYDGSLLETKLVAVGETPVYEGETPVKPATTSKEYTFTGWSPALAAISNAPVTYTAQFSEKTREYTVQWVNYNGTVLKEEKVAYGTTPTAPVAPTRPNDNYYTYTFDAWSPAIASVGGDQTYTATYNYEKQVPKYTATFMNGSETVYAPSLKSGEVPVFDGTIPTKTADAQYTYTFDGWSTTDGGALAYAAGAALPALTADVTYYAHFATTTNNYRIIWKSENGKVTLETDPTVPYGTAPSFNGAKPTKDRMGATVYTFDGWSSAIGGGKIALPSVTGNATYYAHFSDDPVYTVTFDANGHGTAPSSQEVVENQHVTEPDAPVAAEWIFGGWYKEAECTNAWNFASDVVTANRTLYAKWTPVVASVTVNSATTYYATIDDAFTAANNATAASTLTLLQDVTVTTKLTYNNSNNKDCILDLNGHTLTSNTSEQSPLHINNTSVTFTITDGTEEKAGKLSLTTSYSDGAIFGVYVQLGTLQQNAGTIEVTSSTANTCGVTADQNGIFTMNGGTIHVKTTNGSKQGRGVYLAGSVSINGGTVHVEAAGTAYGIRRENVNSSTITVNDGKFNVIGSTAYVTNQESANSKVVIRGGYYTTNSQLYPTAPYHVLPLTGVDPYKYEVAEAYMITFKTGDDVLQSTAVKKGATPAYSGATPTKLTDEQYSYTFTGWSPALATVIEAATYTAQFSSTPRTYTVTLNPNGGTINAGDVTEYTYGTGATLPTNVTKDGHEFGGWFDNDGLTGDAVTSISNTATGNKEYWAKWTEKSYAVTFNNGGHGTVAVAGATVANGATASVNHFTTKSLEATASTGYTFAGWTTTGSVTLGSTSAASTTIKTTAAGGTVTATWTPISYTITYNNLEGASNSNPANYNIESANITLVDPGSRAGYDFVGWYTNEELTTPAGTPAIATGSTGAKTFWAKWTSAESGFYVDIVDVDNSAKTLTLNVTGWASSGWPYTVNEVVYEKGNRKADRTLLVPYTGEVGETFSITVTNKNSVIVSKHNYIIPAEITSSVNLADQQILYVKSGATLTVNVDKTVKNIYVAPGAKMVVNNDITLTADTVFLRTTPWASAELELDGTISGQVCYTRIIKKKDQYYQFGLPMPCAIDDVRLSDGSTPVYGNGWLLRSYSEQHRAQHGSGADIDNWVTLTNEGADVNKTIQGCVGYEMFSNSGYYREYYFPVAHTGLADRVAVTRTTEATVGAAQEGWNIIVSPLMRTYTQSPAPEGATLSWLQEDGSYWQLPVTEIKPAIPFSYQATQTGYIVFDSEISLPAPQRRVAAAEEYKQIQWLQLDLAGAEGQKDETSIYAHPTRYEQTYQIGIDVAKQSLTATRALIYSSHAYGEMAFAGVSDELLEQGVALTVYSPKEQELTISMRKNDWLNRMAYVWLIDQATGAQIDLLESDYSFNAEAGTTAGRFILMGAFFSPQITTDNGNVQSDDEHIKVTKFIYNDKMYIQINGVIYDATGKLVK